MRCDCYPQRFEDIILNSDYALTQEIERVIQSSPRSQAPAWERLFSPNLLLRGGSGSVLLIQTDSASSRPY
jgi:hypothetical protein